jgi:hypothetical protein
VHITGHPCGNLLECVGQSRAPLVYFGFEETDSLCLLLACSDIRGDLRGAKSALLQPIVARVVPGLIRALTYPDDFDTWTKDRQGAFESTFRWV